MSGRHRGRPGVRTGGACAGDRGAVTAELAIGMVAVAVVLVAVLTLGAASVTRLRAEDAARTAARVAALHEPDAAVVEAARTVLGGRAAQVGVRRDGDWVTVTVTSALTGWAAGIEIKADATARVEP